MKYELDLQDMIRYERKKAELRGFKRGEKRGEVKKSLEVAQKLIVIGRQDLNEIAKTVKLPMEQVIALKDGCTVEDIMKQYGDFD